jgi:hypothetical protein
MTEPAARDAEDDETWFPPEVRVEDMFIAMGQAEPAPPRLGDAD